MTDVEINEDDDDDVPWASPEIQRDYEAALGRFMLAFNRLDNLLGRVIGIILDCLDRQDLRKDCVETADFSLRLRYLDLLKHSSEGSSIARISVRSMKEISQERNFLAHGHFDQNPYDGSYQLAGRSEKKAAYYSPARLDGLADKATEAWQSLRHAEAIYDFRDVKIEPPPEG